MSVNLLFESISELGVDYIGRRINLVKGSISIEGNERFSHHLIFWDKVNNKVSLEILNDNIQRINNLDLDSYESNRDIIKDFKNHYCSILTKNTIEIFMIDKCSFVAKTTVSDIPINKNIEINNLKEW